MSSRITDPPLLDSTGQDIHNVLSSIDTTLVQNIGNYQEILDLKVKVPNPPNPNGTYVLKCTVSAGQASYAWVLE